MKQTHKPALDNKAHAHRATAPRNHEHQGQYYTVTITRGFEGDGKQQLTNKTFHLKDLPVMLQAIDEIKGQRVALA